MSHKADNQSQKRPENTLASSQGAEAQTSSNGFYRKNDAADEATGDNNQSRNNTAVHQQQGSAMKTISLVLIVYASVLASCGNNQSGNTEQQPAKDSTGVMINIAQALKDWRRDSLGCLELRMRASEAGILDSIRIDSLLQEEVIELLGTPNRTHTEKKWLEAEEKEEELLILTYDISSYCSTNNGILSSEPIAWVNITILPRTKRVVKVMGAAR